MIHHSVSKNRAVLMAAAAVILLICFNQPAAHAQIDTEISKEYLITLKDGGTVKGKIVSQNSEQIVVQTSSMGDVTIRRSDITGIRELSSKDALKGWFPNPNPSKYLIGNSAIPLEKGRGYYQNTWIFFNGASYAFTDNLSITGGVEIFSLLAGGDGPFAFYLNPKMSFEVTDNLYLGGNILYVNSFRSFEDFSGLGTLNAFGTYGNDNNNITAGVGWGFYGQDLASRPVITIGGMARAGRRIAFVSENWLIPVDGMYGIYSYGIRFLGENISLDLAFINNADIASGLVIGIPFLDFVFNF